MVTRGLRVDEAKAPNPKAPLSSSTFKSSIYVGATISGSTYSFNTPTKEGYTFAGWSIGSSGSEIYLQGQIISAPSGDVTFTANWTAQ